MLEGEGEEKGLPADISVEGVSCRLPRDGCVSADGFIELGLDKDECVWLAVALAVELLDGEVMIRCPVEHGGLLDVAVLEHACEEEGFFPCFEEVTAG